MCGNTPIPRRRARTQPAESRFGPCTRHAHRLNWLYMQRTPFAAILSLAAAAASLFAQAPPAPKITQIMATLTLKPGVTRDQISKVMQAEVRDTVRLYLDGKIQQWYVRGDGKGVIFFLDCRTVDEAKTIVEALPLVKGNFASFDYMPVGPLSPLGLLLPTSTP